MTVLVLPDVDAAHLVSANRRIHHHQRAKVVRYWRDLTRAAALHVGLDGHDRAHITITFRYPDRRRRDTSNLYSYVAKSCVDGLVDAGVIPDDDDAHLIGPDLRRDPECGPHLVTITIQELP